MTDHRSDKGDASFAGFRFKGDRQYVHGTDIFDAILKHFSGAEMEFIDVKFNGVAESQLRLESGRGSSARKVDLAYGQNGETKFWQLIETGEEVTERYEYDEELVSTNSIRTDNKIESKLDNQFSFIEYAVALNKRLLVELFPEKQGKWYFTRIELKFLPDVEESGKLEITMTKNLSFKLTKSLISFNEVNVGNIYFSMVEQ